MSMIYGVLETIREWRAARYVSNICRRVWLVEEGGGYISLRRAAKVGRSSALPSLVYINIVAVAHS